MVFVSFQGISGVVNGFKVPEVLVMMGGAAVRSPHPQAVGVSSCSPWENVSFWEDQLEGGYPQPRAVNGRSKWERKGHLREAGGWVVRGTQKP